MSRIVGSAIGLVAALASACGGEPRSWLDAPARIERSVVEGEGDPAPLVFTLRNTGTCPLDWSVRAATASGVAWLAAGAGAGGTATAGTLAPSDAPTPLTVTLRSAAPISLPPGTHTGAVVIRATGCSGRVRDPVQSIEVSLTVRAPPRGVDCPAKIDGPSENETSATPGCNDTPATADGVAIQVATRGSFGEPADVDYYRLEVPALQLGQRVSVKPAPETPAGARPRPVVDIYLADGTLWAQGLRGPLVDVANESAREVWFPGPGTYFARVQNTNAHFGSDAAYELLIYPVTTDPGVVPGFPADVTALVRTPTADDATATSPRFPMTLLQDSTVHARVVSPPAQPGTSTMDYRLLVYEITGGDLQLVFRNDDETPLSADPGGLFTAPHSGAYLFVIDWAGPFVTPSPVSLRVDCAPGHTPYLAEDIFIPTCLPTPNGDLTCAPPLPTVCDSRPNLISNGGFETASVEQSSLPPGWMLLSGLVLDEACNESPQPADCYQFPTTYFAEGTDAADGRRFVVATPGSPLMQPLAAPLSPGHTYRFGVKVRRSPVTNNNGRMGVRVFLEDDGVDGQYPAYPSLGHTCEIETTSAWEDRAFTFTAPITPNARRVLVVSTMYAGYTTRYFEAGIDSLTLHDITGCP